MSVAEYESLLRDLNAKMLKYGDDSSEAEAVRLAMESPWFSLSEEERAKMRELSVRLYEEQEEARGG